MPLAETLLEMARRHVALGERLVHLGRRGLQIRHRAICMHQWHERGYVSDEALRENRRIRRETARTRAVRTPYGIAKAPAAGS